MNNLYEIADMNIEYLNERYKGQRIPAIEIIACSMSSYRKYCRDNNKTPNETQGNAFINYIIRKLNQ